LYWKKTKSYKNEVTNEKVSLNIEVSIRIL